MKLQRCFSFLRYANLFLKFKAATGIRHIMNISPLRSSSVPDKSENFMDVSYFEWDNNNLCNVDMEKLLETNPEIEKKLKLLKLKVDICRQGGIAVPRKLNEKQWMNLLNCDGSNSMQTLLHYYYRREIYKKRLKEVQKIKLKNYEAARKAERESEPVKVTTIGPIKYSLKHNSLFMRIREQKTDHLLNYKLMMASIFSPTILIDCSYQNYMSTKDTSVLLKQIKNMFSYNRDHLSPAHLMFCNLYSDGILMKKLSVQMPGIREPDYPFFSTAKHYLDLYPKDELVYLSPDAPQHLRKYNCDDVYILGGYVGLQGDEPVSKARAKREGLRMAKLPIENEVIWSQYGRKSLSLDQVVNILNDLRTTNDWDYAKRHVRGDREFSADFHPYVQSSTAIAEKYLRKELYDRLLGNLHSVD